ncbi:unnamed protein product [Schistosoma turkestanicum]|nr:unnamed protein product [Schistosoma turkestanicum]
MSANIGNEYEDGAYEDANEAVNGDAGYAAQNEGAANEAADRQAEHAENKKGAGHEEANQNVGDELQNKHIVDMSPNIHPGHQDTGHAAETKPNVVLSIEAITRENIENGKNRYHQECLRLEKLYFTKWAKHYLSDHGALQQSISQKWKQRELLDDIIGNVTNFTVKHAK